VYVELRFSKIAVKLNFLSSPDTYDNGWKYEFWVPNHERIVYAIHGGKYMS